MCLFGLSWAGRRDAVGRTLPRDGLALDIGCGSGILLSRLPERSGGKIGIDPSRPMVRWARARGCQVVQADAAGIPLRDSSVYGVVCSYPGPWIRSPLVWTELARVTAPGASVTILLGGTVRHGRCSTIRSKLISLLYGSSSDKLPDIDGIGHVRIPGRLCLLDDEWGQAIRWTGVRRDNL